MMTNHTFVTCWAALLCPEVLPHRCAAVYFESYLTDHLVSCRCRPYKTVGDRKNLGEVCLLPIMAREPALPRTSAETYLLLPGGILHLRFMQMRSR